MLDNVRGDEQRRALYRSMAFDAAREALAKADAGQRFQVVGLAGRHGQNPTPTRESSGRRQARGGKSYFSPDDNCVGKITEMFGTARASVDVCVFTITDNRIVDAMERAHRRNVQVRVISDDDKAMDAGSDIDRLERMGIPVRVDRSEHHMHHKFAIFDKSKLLTGSYNWTRSASLHNEENFLITTDRDLLKDFTRMFDKLWRDFS